MKNCTECPYYINYPNDMDMCKLNPSYTLTPELHSIPTRCPLKHKRRSNENN